MYVVGMLLFSSASDLEPRSENLEIDNTGGIWCRKDINILERLCVFFNRP